MFSSPPLMVKRYNNTDFNSLVNFARESEYLENNVMTYPDSSKPYSVLHENAFENLFKFVNKSIEEYVTVVYKSTQKLRVTQSWLNRMQPDKEHVFHYHPNSVLSGVFYLQSDESSPLTLINDIKDQYQLSVDGSENKYTRSSYMSPSSEKTLLVFPSYIRHCVTRNNSNQDRISLSFNTFPVGDFGCKEGLTHVYV
jgi:uncharacterized protein (TIGR02466 family)